MTQASRIFGITGWKNAGKTRMVAGLVAEFTRLGLKVSTVKHAHHSFDIDREGSDSWQHRKAGAAEVALVSSRRWALMHELQDEREPPLDEILARLSPCDLVLVEGFKREGHAKLEVVRRETLKDKPLWPDDPSIVLVVSADDQPGCDRPVLDPDDCPASARFIAARLGIGTGTG